MIQGSPCWAKWQRVHRSCGEGENRGNKPIVLAVLGFWVQLSTAFIKGLGTDRQSQQRAGVPALT